jgi:hypothetical protein
VRLYGCPYKLHKERELLAVHKRSELPVAVDNDMQGARQGYQELTTSVVSHILNVARSGSARLTPAHVRAASSVRAKGAHRNNITTRWDLTFEKGKKKCRGKIIDRVCEACRFSHYRRRTCGVKITHSPIALANLSSINLVSVFRCSSPPHNPVYERCVDPSIFPFSLSSHRHSYVSLLFISHFID